MEGKFYRIQSFPSDIEDESGALIAVSQDDAEHVFTLLLSSDDPYFTRKSSKW